MEFTQNQLSEQVQQLTTQNTTLRTQMRNVLHMFDALTAKVEENDPQNLLARIQAMENISPTPRERIVPDHILFSLRERLSAIESTLTPSTRIDVDPTPLYNFNDRVSSLESRMEAAEELCKKNQWGKFDALCSNVKHEVIRQTTDDILITIRAERNVLQQEFGTLLSAVDERVSAIESFREDDALLIQQIADRLPPADGAMGAILSVPPAPAINLPEEVIDSALALFETHILAIIEQRFYRLEQFEPRIITLEGNTIYILPEIRGRFSKADARMYEMERSIQHDLQPRIARLEQGTDTSTSSFEANFNRMQDIATAMSVDIARVDHSLGLIHPQTDANYESLVLITAKINLCEIWQHQAAQDERDLRSRLSLAEANLSSFFVLIEQAFSSPMVESTPSNAYATSVFAPARAFDAVPPQAHTVQDPDSQVRSLAAMVESHQLPRYSQSNELYAGNDYNYNRSEVYFPPTFDDVPQPPVAEDTLHSPKATLFLKRAVIQQFCI